MTTKTCSIDGCDKPTHARGWCIKHWNRWHRHGDPNYCQWDEPEADRFSRYVTKDANVLGCWQWTGGTDRHGYGVFPRSRNGSNSQRVGAHRYAFEQANGPIPDGLVVDHMCHNHLCVNPAHLRIVTIQHNVQNRDGLSKNNTTGFTGVSRVGNRYRATVKRNGRSEHLGYFDTPEQAGAAAADARRRCFNLADIRKDAA